MPQYDFWVSSKGDGHPLDRLKAEPFFAERLLLDIHSGEVFPAIRKSKIDFYYLGRKLCSYTGKHFRSNIAYLAAFQDRPKGEITEDAFRQLKVCRSFADGYSQIKDNIALHEQDESGGVFELCQNHSCCRSSGTGAIVVLDVESSREAFDEVHSQDRIDLVLLHTTTRQLRFIEVKTFANKEVWPGKDGKVPVVEQIARYRRQLEQNHDRLLGDYCQYVLLLNDLCRLRLPEPTSIDMGVDLLVLGFDGKDNEKIENALLPSLTPQFTCHCIGSAKRASSGTLAKWWKSGR